MSTYPATWLKEHSIGGSAAERKKLSTLLEDELEMRVGNAIMKHLSDEQITEFEAIYDDPDAPEDAALEWLEQTYPDYTKIVATQTRKLRAEVLASTQPAEFITHLSDTNS